jgi:hypothetical protein
MSRFGLITLYGILYRKIRANHPIRDVSPTTLETANSQKGSDRYHLLMCGNYLEFGIRLSPLIPLAQEDYKLKEIGYK